MTPYLSKSALLVSLMSLGACTGSPSGGLEVGASNDPESVLVSVGPCFGFCPIYDVRIGSDGMVAFTGKRHTAELGDRTLRGRASLYSDLKAELAPFKPADGETATIACAAAMSDTATYTITWTNGAGLRTTAVLKSRCPAGPGHALDAILNGLPQRLGIDAWAKQTTRPDTSRG